MRLQLTTNTIFCLSSLILELIRLNLAYQYHPFLYVAICCNNCLYILPALTFSAHFHGFEWFYSISITHKCNECVIILFHKFNIVATLIVKRVFFFFLHDDDFFYVAFHDPIITSSPCCSESLYCYV